MSDKLRDVRKPGWFWVDNKIVSRDGAEMGAYAIAVYCALAMHAGDKTRAWPSYKTLAKELGCSPNTVSKAVDALIDKGWIRKERRGERDEEGNIIRYYSNMYYLLDASGEGYSPGEEGSSPDEQGGCSPDAQEKESVVIEKESTNTIGGGFNIFSAYGSIMGLMVNSPYEQQKLEQIEEDFPEEWIVDAMKICVENNKRKLSYLLGILNRWQKEGRDSKPSDSNGTGVPVFDEATGEFRL